MALFDGPARLRVAGSGRRSSRAAMLLCYPTPLTECRTVCTVSRLVPLCLFLLGAACTQRPTSKSAVGETGRDSIDSAQAHLTAHYVKLLRAQLTAKDPYQAHVAIYCEGSRIMILLTNEADDPLEGENKAVRILRAAERRAYTPADKRAWNRWTVHWAARCSIRRRAATRSPGPASWVTR